MSEKTQKIISITLAILVILGAAKLILFPSDEAQILTVIEEGFTLFETPQGEQLPRILRKSRQLSDVVTDPTLIQFSVHNQPKATIHTRDDLIEKFIQVKAHLDLLEIERLNLDLKIEVPKAKAKLVLGYKFRTKTNNVLFGDRSLMDINLVKKKKGWKITEIVTTPFKEDVRLSE